jgi:hypothetical protein
VKEGTIRDFIAEGNAVLHKLNGILPGVKHMPQDVAACLESEGIDIDVYCFF